MLKRDFEKYGVHLEGHQQQTLQSLVATCHEVGMLIGEPFPTNEVKKNEVAVSAWSWCRLNVTEFQKLN